MLTYLICANQIRSALAKTGKEINHTESGLIISLPTASEPCRQCSCIHFLSCFLICFPCMCAGWGHVATVHPWRSEDSSKELGFSSHHVGLRDPTQVIRPGEPSQQPKCHCFLEVHFQVLGGESSHGMQSVDNFRNQKTTGMKDEATWQYH